MPGGVTTEEGDGEEDTAGATAGPTSKAVCAREPKYAFEPSKVATIVYSPSPDGVQPFLYIPLLSLTTVPMSVEAPLESIAESFTGTPAAFVGAACCL